MKIYENEKLNMKTKKRKNKKSVVNEEKIYEPFSIYQSIITSIVGAIFTASMMWLEIKTVDNITRIVALPFLVVGIGAFLQGVLPLVFYKNARNVMNIGKYIYLFTFFSFWFIFLIVMDIAAMRDKNIGMVVFSLIFWVAGIFNLIVILKN